jgi:glycosyltransferase involved in cell wall biosynthesis
MLRVLSIVPMPYVSGLQNMILDFFGHVSPAIRSHFLLTRWSDGAFARRLDELDIAYSYSWLGFFSRSLRPQHLVMTLDGLSRLPILYFDYVRILRRFQPDLIYTANYHELLLLWPLFRLFRKPIVCHMADPAPAAPFYRRCADFYDQVVTRYIVISRSVGRRLAQLGIATEKMTLLHPGLDLTEQPMVRPRTELFIDKFHWPADSIIVGITGQMMPAKGHEDLLEAFHQLQKMPSLRCVIGGKPVEPFYSRLQARIHELGLQERVAFSGWLAKVNDFFAGIDILVVPSRQEEGFGLVATEAMATGVPVVATRSGGLLDIVQDGRSGMLVDRQQPAQLANAIRLLAATPELRLAMGQSGRQRVVQAFDLGKQTASFEQILQHTRSAGCIN